MVQVRQWVKEFDLFSTPFVFFVGEKKSKSTFIGGALSLSIIIVSMGYLYYLMNMYLSGKVEPKITSSIAIENDRNIINVSENFFFFQMLIKGEPLSFYEQRVGKKFLTFHLYYEKYDSQGTINYVDVPLVACRNAKFNGYLCMEDLFLKDGNDLYLEPIKNLSSDYALSVEPCDSTIEINCATSEEIYAIIFSSSNYFSIYTKLQQYRNLERKFIDSYKQDYFYFDPSQISYTRMSLIKANTEVISGLVIQSSTDKETIFDIQRVDTYFSLENLYERMGLKGYAYIVFEVNQMRNIIVIQHAMITEILAQFMSIFNSLLTIGILARMIAQSHIVEEINNILLKEYYKNTAIKLLQKGKQNIQTQKLNNLIVERDELNNLKQKTKGKGISETKLSAQVSENDKLKMLQTLKEKIPTSQKYTKIEGLINNNKKINQTDFAKKSLNYFKMTNCQRFKIFVYQLLGLTIDKQSKKQDKLSQSDESDMNIYHSLLKKSIKRINIFEVYKDIIKLKMAIKLILTKEQYAATLFCGSEIIPESKIPLVNEISEDLLPISIESPIYIEQENYEKQPDHSKIKVKFSALPLVSISSLSPKNEGYTDLKQQNRSISLVNLNIQRNQTIISQNTNTMSQESSNQKITCVQKDQNSSQFKQVEDQSNAIEKMILEMKYEHPGMPLFLQIQSKKQNPQRELIIKCQGDKSQSLLTISDESISKGEEVIQSPQPQNEEKCTTFKVDRNKFSSTTNAFYQVDYPIEYENVTPSSQRNLRGGQENKESQNETIIQCQNTEERSKYIKSHLAEMDEIEENPKLQQKYLQMFLNKINRSNNQIKQNQLQNNETSNIDKNIYQSLLFDSQSNSDNDSQNYVINSLDRLQAS